MILSCFCKIQLMEDLELYVLLSLDEGCISQSSEESRAISHMSGIPCKQTWVCQLGTCALALAEARIGRIRADLANLSESKSEAWLPKGFGSWSAYARITSAAALGGC